LIKIEIFGQNWERNYSGFVGSFVGINIIKIMAKIFVVDKERLADVKVFNCSKDRDADLLFFKTEKERDAKGDFLWHFVQKERDATVKIFWVDRERLADIKVFRVENSRNTKWNKNNSWTNRLG